jgi:tape measure domain-containing protein
MARASVELIVEAARAINPLRRVERQTKRVEEQFEKARRSTKRVEAALVLMGRRGINVVRDLEKNTARLGRTMGGLRGNIGKAVIGFAAFKSVQTGIQRLESERRIKLLGQRFGEVGQLQSAAAAAARKFNISQTEANQSLANAFARLRPLGVSLKDITSTFGGFRTAAVLGGATAAEASAAFTQLSQALGSGALRGDEFRSIAEQAPLVLQAISDETGVAAGDLKEYAAEGLLTSDIVIKALKRIESEGANRLAQALGGPAAKIKDFQNKVEDLQVAFTESAIPAITDSISDLGTVIKQLEPLIRGLGTLLAGVARTVGNVVENVASGGKTVRARQLATQAATLQTNAKFGTPGILGRSAEANAFFEETLERELSRRLAIARGAVPGQLPPSAADIGETPKGTSPIKLPPKKEKKGKTPQEIALERAEKLNAKLGRQAQIQLANVSEIVTKREQETQLLTLQAEKGQEFAEFTQRVLDLVNQGVPFSEAFDLEMANKNARDLVETQERLNALYEQAGQTISTAIVDSLMQAKSVTEALSGALQQVARQLVQLGVNSLLKSIGGPLFSALPGFANGGRPAVGRPSIVGERGPELFVPDRAGTVIPNHAMGGANVTVNVDASGSSVEGNANQAAELGKMLGAAVQAELVKQKRPGGLLAT